MRYVQQLSPEARQDSEVVKMIIYWGEKFPLVVVKKTQFILDDVLLKTVTVYWVISLMDLLSTHWLMSSVYNLSLLLP